MADEGKLRQEMALGAHMAAMLEDGTLLGLFKKLEEEAVQEWRDCEDASKASSSDAWHRLRALDSLRAELQSVVNTGKMAATQYQGLQRGKDGDEAG